VGFVIDTQTIINYWESLPIIIKIGIVVVGVISLLLIICKILKFGKNEDDDTLIIIISIISIAMLHAYTIITISTFISILLKNPDSEILKYFTILCIGILALHSIFTWKMLETVKK